ncbi:hypothetical protein E2C01_016122 [Portunus trituberculatus]|uniref:Uncharacterized protein n=1 Tax=Portunus trituberculatus TaxID=210409 RepID=A0A5B7DPX7_PORTR|nr:hypothetical protein [Portunus trituberculatus]
MGTNSGDLPPTWPLSAQQVVPVGRMDNGGGGKDKSGQEDGWKNGSTDEESITDACLLVTLSPYDSMASLVGRCPQSWDTTIGKRSWLGRYLSNRSSERRTAASLLQAISSTGSTGPSSSGGTLSKGNKTEKKRAPLMCQSPTNHEQL